MNKCCAKCLWLHDTCNGVYPHGADTSGMMHCFTSKTGTKKGNKKKKLSSELRGIEGRIRQLKSKKKMLKAELKAL